GEGDDGGADGGDLGRRGGRSHRAEVGIGPVQLGLFGRGRDRHGAAGFQQGGDPGFAAFDRLGRDHQGQRALAFEGVADGGADLFGAEVFHRRLEQRQIGGGRREDPVVVHGVQKRVGQGRGAARGGGLDGVFEGGAGVGDL